MAYSAFPQSPLREGEAAPFQSNALSQRTGGMGVLGDISGDDIASGAVLLRTMLGAAGRAMDDNSLRMAASALGGANAVYDLATAVANGSLSTMTGITGAGAALSAVLGLAAQATGNRDLAIAATAAGAATSAATVAASSAAVAAGTAGLAATAGVAMAPITIPYAVMSISDIFAGQRDAGQLEDRVKKLMGGLQPQLDNIKRGAQMGLSVNDQTSVEDAERIAQELYNITGDFKGSGTYEFLEDGVTRVKSSTEMGKGSIGFEFPQGPAILKSLRGPFDDLRAGQIRAADIVGKAGKTPAGWGFPAADDKGKLSAGAWYDPITLAEGSGTEAFDKAFKGKTAADLVPFQGGYHVPGADSLVNESQATQAERDKHTYIDTPYGIRYKPIYDQLMQIQPGNIQSGLAEVFAPYGGYNEAYASRFNVPGTAAYQPPTIPITGGMRAGIGGQTPGVGSPLTSSTGATVSPDITLGLQEPQTGFVSGGVKTT